ncbi:MAG: membrane protein insertion efficiency factor YidD [Deltaproteobacteria bacterium]|nr:membrane protein insertion efficiency factor YidD [Deltaproteobacteria bacterium]
MVAIACAMLCLVADAVPAFGPFATERQPVVGRVATVPGQGFWEAVPPVHGEIALAEARKTFSRHAGSGNPLFLAYLLYRYFISPQDGPRCQHYPTCAQYGVLAMRKHGILGIAMTIDRLWQSGQPTAVRPYPVVRVHGTPRFYDPVEASDFWFTEKKTP